MSVAEARAEARADIGPLYSGIAHFAFVNAFALAIIAYATTRLHAPRWSLLTVPLTFLYANYVEYRAHKGPMHHRTRGLGLVFERHTLMHHQVFTQDDMRAGSTRDFKLVLFPPVLLIFFFGFFALPISLVLQLIFGWNVAALFAITAMAYYLLYEWLHLSYHLGLSGSLARHHAAHHDPQIMTTHNFNITFPLMDRLFGTCR